MIKGGGRFDNALILLKDIKRGKFDLESEEDSNYNHQPLKKIKTFKTRPDPNGRDVKKELSPKI